jgi:hypothetical protein
MAIIKMRYLIVELIMVIPENGTMCGEYYRLDRTQDVQ